MGNPPSFVIYNLERGTAEQWIKEGKHAINWTRLSCHDHRSLTTMREKLVKIGAKVVEHSRYVIFQMAEVAVPRVLFEQILRRIRRLRPVPI
jgi:hypothetical protein